MVNNNLYFVNIIFLFCILYVSWNTSGKFNSLVIHFNIYEEDKHLKNVPTICI